MFFQLVLNIFHVKAQQKLKKKKKKNLCLFKISTKDVNAFVAKNYIFKSG